MKKSEIFFGILRIPIDFLMIIAAFLIAFKLRAVGDFIPFIQLSTSIETFPEFYEYLKFASKAGIVFLLFLAFNHSYALKITTKLSREFKIILTSAFVWFTTILAYYFLTRTFPFSRLVLIYSFIFSIVTLFFGRLLIRFWQNFLLKYGIGKRNVLVLGKNKISENLVLALKNSSNYQVFSPKKIIYNYSSENLSKLVDKFKIEEIIQTENKIKDQESRDILEFCRENHIQYHFVPDLLEVQRSNVEFFSIGGVPIMSLKPTSLDGWGRVSKRIFDFVISLMLLIILTPVFILISIIIKLDSKGPVFFTKLDDGSPVKRVGEKGQFFRFFKFRSMRDKSDSLRYGELLNQSHRKGPLIKIKDDPRITKVGKFIRKYSIDELPQLFNVFVGNLSLVGPRAHLPEEVAKYQNPHKFVLTIKPGITGLAQISGRSDLDFEKEVQLDTYYIENWSLWLDLKILFKTIFVVMKGEGAD